MPIYTYKCKKCKSLTDSYNMISNRHKAPKCKCGGKSALSIQATQLAPILGGGDWDGYMCPVTDEFVSSRRRRKYIMDENNLVDVGDRPASKKRVDATERNLANDIAAAS